MDQDLNHLKVLSIFHYVVAGMAALFACIPLVHFFMGLAMATGRFGHSDPEVAPIGFVLMVIAGLFIVAGWALAVLLAVSARFPSQHRHYTYCLVMAAIACLFMPFGTILGVFTIVVLMRESVRELFEIRAHSPAPSEDVQR